MNKFFIILAFLIGNTALYAQKTTIQDVALEETRAGYGIVGQQAPELTVQKWVDSSGNETTPYKLSDFKGKFKVIYCFQAWCPGCHRIGLPSLKKMVTSLANSDKVTFLAIQTVFEGRKSNSFKKMVKTQKQYNLEIPFGHDDGENNPREISSTIQNYKTGGTPWFILIDESNKVVFNGFHLNTDKTIEYLKGL